MRDYGYALNIVCPASGWIEAICGPMFSGKTEELIRRLKRSMIARKQVQVFKPRIDNRYADAEIVTHFDLRMPAETADSADEILARVHPRTQVLGIDESHFFGERVVEVATRLADNGVQTIVAGLDMDYLGRPFPPMPNLLALAEVITKTLAICVRCGNPANHTQRLAPSKELIFVGAVDSYEARCRRCFEPGISGQEQLEFGPSFGTGTSASD